MLTFRPFDVVLSLFLPLISLSLCGWQAKNLRGRQITAIGAGRYHSALATESHVYTFGQNLGQLGYERNYHTQIIPKAVRTLSYSICLYIVPPRKGSNHYVLCTHVHSYTQLSQVVKVPPLSLCVCVSRCLVHMCIVILNYHK